MFYPIRDRNLLDVCLIILSFVKHNHEPKHDLTAKRERIVLYKHYGVMDKTLLDKCSIYLIYFLQEVLTKSVELVNIL